jgi:murein DD-endopeptidase MepM/ murein hydrolase activator NlpD
MAVIVAAKTAIEVNKNVKKFVPGGWKTVIALALIIGIFVPLVAIKAATNAIAPFLKGGYQEACSTSVTNGDDGNKSGEKSGSDNSAPVGSWEYQWTTARTPWPTESTDRVVYPAPNPVLTSPWGPRDPVATPTGTTFSFHNGLDFGQPAGSPVLAFADGVVATAKAGGSPFGSHVAIKHTINGKHYTSVYGHVIGSSITVKVGDTVKAGQQIAGVGMEGFSTGFHIHFTIAQGDYSPNLSESFTQADAGPGNTIDPKPFLASHGAVEASGGLTGTDFSGVTKASDTKCSKDDDTLEGDGFSSWGGFQNGEITGLAPIPFSKNFQLMARASSDLGSLNTDFNKKFGHDLTVQIAYRNKEVQEQLYDKGDQIEKPGMSIYGWARAVKVNVSFGTPEYDWLIQNGSKYGWGQPSNYRQGGSAANAGIWGYTGGGSGGDIPPASNASAEESRAIAKKILEQDHGWGQNEYACLVKLWEHESNWNYKAENPSSGAYGIVQALPPEKMSTVGSDWRTNPATQIKWGLQYIEGRYKTPCGAWTFWQETDPAKKSGYPGNWY